MLTSSESLPSASRSIISMISSHNASPLWYPSPQLLAAPLPSLLT
jgi:hypothetical protein